MFRKRFFFICSVDTVHPDQYLKLHLLYHSFILFPFLNFIHLYPFAIHNL
jgi:hypothetical protein